MEESRDRTEVEILVAMAILMASVIGFGAGWYSANEEWFENSQKRVFMVLPNDAARAGVSSHAKGTIEYPKPTRELKGDREDVNDSR